MEARYKTALLIVILHLLAGRTIAASYLCGRQTVLPFDQLKIVGGIEARRASWPWTVFLAFNAVSGPFCGGTLIDERYVLTAAHCVDTPNSIYRFVFIGNHYFNETVIRSSINKVHIHPEYIADPETGSPNDLALLELNTTINMTQYPAICLASLKIDTVGSLVVATGWGLDSNTVSSWPLGLKQVTLPILDPDVQQCRDLIKNAERQVCAGVLEGNQGTCYVSTRILS